jgi:hypothetical protein
VTNLKFLYVKSEFSEGSTSGDVPNLASEEAACIGYKRNLFQFPTGHTKIYSSVPGPFRHIITKHCRPFKYSRFNSRDLETLEFGETGLFFQQFYGI